MTHDDWSRILAWIAQRWPHVDWPAHTAKALYTDLAHVDADTAMQAVRNLYDAGTDYLSPSKVNAECRRVHADAVKYGTNPAGTLELEAPQAMSGETFRELMHDGRGWAEVVRGIANTMRADSVAYHQEQP